jgi:GTP-binding protein EngB required for normal cell division
MNMLFSPIVKLVGAATIALFVFGYMKVLLSQKEALEASVELYKRQAEIAVVTSNENAKKYADLQYRNEEQNKKLLALQNSIDKIKEEQHSSEKEIVKYVHSLPEGFEKSCLAMPVPSAISGMSNN